jgi:transposase
VVCGWNTKPHGHDEWVQVRHLPVFGRPTYLRYRPRRYRCEKCEKKPTTTQKLVWHEKGSPNTMGYDDHILMQLVHSTVEDVRIKEQMTYDGVLGVMERRISTETDWSRYTMIGRLGLDEIALKKGHRDFVTIVTGRLEDDRIVLLGVLPDRKKDTVTAFLRTIPVRLVKTIDTVCCDMYEGYTEAVREELPEANIIIDRFHVTQHYTKAADKLRQKELKRLKNELSEEEYQQLKGNMWAFRKKKADLTPKERTVLRKLFAHSPDLKLAHQLREKLTAIFELPITKSAAKRKFRAWIKRVQQSILTCFDGFIKTLENWLEEISNFFINRDSSGFVEGFNNKIKVLKRRCYGIFNIQHLFQRIYLDLEGYRLFA